MSCIRIISALHGDTGSVGESTTDDVSLDDVPADGLPRNSFQDSDSTQRLLVDGRGETMLAREMAKLSVAEHETVLYDIHGVAEKEKETPELVAEKLSELETKITEKLALKSPSVSAYITAQIINPDYVRDSAFRLLFLRASHYDVDQACKRLLGHFEKKLELFGPQKLCKTITLDDLDVNDMECMNNGQSQLLPYRDRSGRAVFFQALSHYRFAQVVNAMRVVYYLLMTALEDEDTQERGVVCVVYNVEPRSPLANDPSIYLNVYELLPTLPMRMMGAHYCVEDSRLRLFMSSIRVAMPREVRLRSRVHHGSHQECIYTLLTFGVPRRCFPISNSGELLVDRHWEFVEMRRRKEADNAHTMHHGNVVVGYANRDIVVPKNDDVLLGRGRPYQEHAGNMRCNYIVVDAMEDYEGASRNHKTMIARNLIDRIKAYGGRFLKQSYSGWEEVDDAEALRKISHSFRTHRQLLKTQNNCKNRNTSNENINTDIQRGIGEKRPRAA